MRRLFRFARRSRGDIASDVDAELRFHLDERESELMARGMPADDAHAAALREFGDLDDARQYLRDVDHDIEMRRRRKDYMGEFTQDLGFAFRKLRSSPGFAAVAILTLALGIGANTAIFSVVNGVLLRPLPLPNPEQLVRVWWTDRANSDTRVPVSAVDLDDWRNRAPSVAGISGYFYADGTSGIDLTGGAEAQRLSAAFVELGFFTTLGAHAEAGRLPRPEELTRGGPIRVAVLSHGFWQRQFGGSRTVIDSAITLSGEPFTVIGVMPADFRYPSAKVDVYVPFATITDQMAPRVRTNRFMTAIARLQPGVTVARATTELGGVAQRLSASFVDDSAFSGVTMRSVQADMTLPVRSSLLVLFGAVGIVLLLACVNLASLQLARGTTRAHEMAVRLSLGATRGRIVRQLLTESLVVSLLGGVAGLGVGVLGTDSLLALAADQIPRAAEVRLDATVLAFAIGVSLATGVLFGLIPALRTSAAQPQVSLREG